MTYQFENSAGDCNECGCELWFCQSAAPHADLCDHCYELEIINEECPAPIGHFMYKETK